MRERERERERLAEILIDGESPEMDEGAMSTVKEEVARDATQRDDDRRCRLNHKLGALHVRKNNAKQARSMLDWALEGRLAAGPSPCGLAQEPVTLLVKAIQLDQAYDKARAGWATGCASSGLVRRRRRPHNQAKAPRTRRCSRPWYRTAVM